MAEFLFKIWWMVAVMPLYMFMEGSKMFGEFLKKRDIYAYWDIWHSVVVFLVILLMILWFNGFRP